MLLTDSRLAHARLGQNSPSVWQRSGFTVWKWYKRFHSGPTDPHLQFMVLVSGDDPTTRPWFSISFEISSLAPHSPSSLCSSRWAVKWLCMAQRTRPDNWSFIQGSEDTPIIIVFLWLVWRDKGRGGTFCMEMKRKSAKSLWTLFHLWFKLWPRRVFSLWLVCGMLKSHRFGLLCVFQTTETQPHIFTIILRDKNPCMSCFGV